MDLLLLGSVAATREHDDGLDHAVDVGGGGDRAPDWALWRVEVVAQL